ncbi:A-kinase anchor protein 9, putative isoform 2 [Quillaja saponaria]|uniref:A-kinase anchor protein 9, putative isoform 2 n=1 Tax=Quillaja saponaria TaxID=32244 RepID=A0AAD7KSQ7_QUISA|nr:A-kinase anchor protein 9, putative isoform 2 [Quillaja saponaria]
MEKLIKPYDREYMRMAMLKQEETFKEQIYELHRLYRIQKILMNSTKSSKHIEQSHERWNFENGATSTTATYLKDARHNKAEKKFDLERPADEYKAESDDDGVLEIIDETEIELTLGPSSYYRPRKKLETPLTSDSGPSFSSSSTGFSYINRTSSRTRQRKDTRREELSGSIIGLVQLQPDSTSRCQNGSQSSNVNIEQQLRQERLKQQPWLFQALSLNVT